MFVSSFLDRVFPNRSARRLFRVLRFSLSIGQTRTAGAQNTAGGAFTTRLHFPKSAAKKPIR
jgi:hypothetical protein